VRAAESLAPAKTGDMNLVVLAAAWLGKTRLIDNLEICLNADKGL
jgi:pantoate--beta-alanine ligase